MTEQTTDGNGISWPTTDFTRIPYAVYTDPDVYAREQERIFRGPTWSYLGLSLEIPEPGDYIVSSIGDTSIIVNRTKEGEICGFVNRGAVLCRDLKGNVANHICVYHQWCFDL